MSSYKVEVGSHDHGETGITRLGLDIAGGDDSNQLAS